MDGIDSQEAGERSCDVLFGAALGLLAIGVRPIASLLLYLFTPSSAGDWRDFAPIIPEILWVIVVLPVSIGCSWAAASGAVAAWRRVAARNPTTSTMVAVRCCAAAGARGSMATALTGVILFSAVILGGICYGAGGLPFLPTIIFFATTLGTTGIWGAGVGLGVYLRRRYGWSAAVGSAIVLTVCANLFVLSLFRCL